jgi:large subunit ribosomal protein L25
MPDESNLLQAQPREPAGSRDARRLRRTGQVPGIVYGGGETPLPFSIDARELRNALAHAGAVLNFQIEGAASTPVVLKELVRHPVSGLTTHLDLLRVNLNTAIQAQVLVELTGVDEAEGVKEGGILEQPTREVTVEALPNSIPDSITHDVTAMNIGDTITIAELVAPQGVTIISDLEQVLATVSASRMARQAEEDAEIETETELVGDAEAGADAEAEAKTGDDTADASGDE